MFTAMEDDLDTFETSQPESWDKLDKTPSFENSQRSEKMVKIYIKDGVTLMTRTPMDFYKCLENEKQENKEVTHLPTGSLYEGEWNGVGMNGQGKYVLPYGVAYTGNMFDGVFHDDKATLAYPNGMKATNCHFELGTFQNCEFEYPDGLNFENIAKTEEISDRRLHTEQVQGLKPAKQTPKTNFDPPRVVPQQEYDTNDGFFHPITKCINDSSHELLRVATSKEEKFIKTNFRKGWVEHVGFRPDLYPNWYSKDTIKNIQAKQELHEKGEITRDELQQYFADIEIQPWFSRFKKRLTISQIEMQEYLESLPQPLILSDREYSKKKYEQHRMPIVVSDAATQLSSVITRKMLKQKSSSHSNVGKQSSSPFRFRRTKSSKTNRRTQDSQSSTNDVSFIKMMILELADRAILLEKERWKLRKYLAISLPQNITQNDKNENCQNRFLHKFNSTNFKSEFGDSCPDEPIIDYSSLAKDKYHELKYWGKRVFTLKFPD